jgi:hypothetical protein
MTRISQLLHEFDAVTKEYNKQKLAVAEQLKTRFHEVFKPLLEAHPVLENVSFTAYTPHFMDGDECIYSVSDLRGMIDGYDDQDGGYDFFNTRYNNIYVKALAYIKTGAVPTYNSYYKSALPWAEPWTSSNEELIDLGAEKLEQIVAAQNAGAEYAQILTSIHEDVIHDMFGDHIMVTIDRDGVTTDPYERD